MRRTMSKTSSKERAVCDAPCPICEHEDIHCMTYACGIVVLKCPKCGSKGTGCSIGGAYSNMKTLNRVYEDKDTRTKNALESIAVSLNAILEIMKGENTNGN